MRQDAIQGRVLAIIHSEFFNKNTVLGDKNKILYPEDNLIRFISAYPNKNTEDKLNEYEWEELVSRIKFKKKPKNYQPNKITESALNLILFYQRELNIPLLPATFDYLIRSADLSALQNGKTALMRAFHLMISPEEKPNLTQEQFDYLIKHSFPEQTDHIGCNAFMYALMARKTKNLNLTLQQYDRLSQGWRPNKIQTTYLASHGLYTAIEEIEALRQKEFLDKKFVLTPPSLPTNLVAKPVFKI